jgi:hypothetical protein
VLTASAAKGSSPFTFEEYSHRSFALERFYIFFWRVPISYARKSGIPSEKCHKLTAVHIHRRRHISDRLTVTMAIHSFSWIYE